MLDRRISVAPMMDCTDRYDRYFLRLIAPHILLYSEMVTTSALIHGDYQRLLQFDHFEHPVALQLGGCDPAALVHSAKLAEEFGYDEINLNVGCPSDRVKSGRFGACLMLNPPLVAECMVAMQEAVKLPVTIKCRIGVDQMDSYEALHHFVSLIAESGCSVFIIHARKAWLNGLSPKQNREIPPLQYDVVYQLKKDFPHLTIIINGGIKTVAEVEEHLKYVDGIMIGREAYANPYILAELEKKFFPGAAVRTRGQVIRDFIPYVQEQLNQKVKLSSMTRHILGLFQSQSGARSWRRYLSENAHLPHVTTRVIDQALALVEEL